MKITSIIMHISFIFPPALLSMTSINTAPDDLQFKAKLEHLREEIARTKERGEKILNAVPRQKVTNQPSKTTSSAQSSQPLKMAAPKKEPLKRIDEKTALLTSSSQLFSQRCKEAAEQQEEADTCCGCTIL